MPARSPCGCASTRLPLGATAGAREAAEALRSARPSGAEQPRGAEQPIGSDESAVAAALETAQQGLISTPWPHDPVVRSALHLHAVSTELGTVRLGGSDSAEQAGPAPFGTAA